MGKRLSYKQELKILSRYNLDNVDDYKRKIRDIDLEIDQLNNHMAEIQDKIKKLQSKKIDVGREVLPSNILFELYYNTGVSPTTICEKFGIRNPAALRNMLDGCILKIPCSKCGEKLEFHPTSKANMKEILKTEQLCNDCVTNIRQQKQSAKMQFGIRLQELKAMDYKDFLKTPEWDKTRKKTLRRAGYKCQLCNRTNTTLNVHHKTYERIGEEFSSDLIVLCKDCHAKFHDQLEENNV